MNWFGKLETGSSSASNVKNERAMSSMGVKEVQAKEGGAQKIGRGNGGSKGNKENSGSK